MTYYQQLNNLVCFFIWSRGNDLVSVVYYRTGYEVEAYPTQNEWSVRLLIERSRAIKCPSIQYHLAGTKKVIYYNIFIIQINKL